MNQITTVGGLEMTCVDHSGNIDEDKATLKPCPFCGHSAGYFNSHRADDRFPIGVCCTNTSCGVQTPQHYRDRQTAALAWNRRSPASGGNCR